MTARRRAGAEREPTLAMYSPEQTRYAPRAKCADAVWQTSVRRRCSSPRRARAPRSETVTESVTSRTARPRRRGTSAGHTMPGGDESMMSGTSACAAKRQPTRWRRERSAQPWSAARPASESARPCTASARSRGACKVSRSQMGSKSTHVITCDKSSATMSVARSSASTCGTSMPCSQCEYPTSSARNAGQRPPRSPKAAPKSR
mmetsp:Transcript_20097/g.68074  ORF Transcript_20097/g.68074 Transcript_20097/m.68074 type:complete len:204 (-) Transcript_20097:415-1026(-)